MDRIKVGLGIDIFSASLRYADHSFTHSLGGGDPFYIFKVNKWNGNIKRNI